MTAIDHETLIAMLDRLKLTAIRDQLDSLLDEAARSKMTLREALAFLVGREIARRDERQISMASKIAQFPFVRELSGFEFDAQPSLDPGQIRELATCRWIAHGDTTLLLGPPGTGKSHLAVSLGREAIRQNYSVQFVTAATLVAMLAKAHAGGGGGDGCGFRRRRRHAVMLDSADHCALWIFGRQWKRVFAAMRSEGWRKMRRRSARTTSRSLSVSKCRLALGSSTSGQRRSAGRSSGG